MANRKWKLGRHRALRTIVFVAIVVETLINFAALVDQSADPIGRDNKQFHGARRQMMLHTNGSVYPTPLLDKTDVEDQETTFSIAACLLVKDDNHWLIEWLAYHYHMTNMRQLIVLPDPDSRTSPLPIFDRWKGRINIQVWNDTRFYFPSDASNPIEQHRNRQTYFYRACMKQYYEMGISWVALIDTDEFVRPNDDGQFKGRNAYSEPGAVSRHLSKAFEDRTNVPLCLALHRYQFGHKESKRSIDPIPGTLLKAGINHSSMMTTRWKYRKTEPLQLVKNMVDVSKLPPQIFSKAPSYTVHRILPDFCPSKHGNPLNHSDSLLLVHHYSGTKKQFHFRKDPRDGSNKRMSFKVATYQASTYDDRVSSWIHGFVSDVGPEAAMQLLRDVGKLETLTPSNLVSNAVPNSTKKEDAKCAILLFGLPRSFKTLVLPSLRKNVLLPNQGCDLFVHYYSVFHETSGRAGEGGRLNSTEIRMLENEKLRVAFGSDTNDSFLSKYGPLLDKLRTTVDPDSEKLRYFPWKEPSFQFPTTMDNVIKMWHSIESAWNLMKQQENYRGLPYKTVAMLRSDVVYLTPIHLYVNLTSALIPSFGKFPVSDRMIVGPREAVKVWATERFTRMENHVAWVQRKRPGYGIHNERFLKWTIFPLIERVAPIVEDPNTCFLRARSDQSVWISDCGGRSSSPSIEQFLLSGGKSIVDIVEETIETKCFETVKEKRALVLKCKDHRNETMPEAATTVQLPESQS